MPEPFDVSKPSHARISDYLLGGTLNFAVDRALAERVLADYPELVENSRANRAWVGRVVELLAGEGITQFLDIGSGLPTAENVHQVAQRIAPAARVLYVDHDPIVLAHGRALLVEDERTDYVEADLRDAEAILHRAEAMLDRARPTAVLASAVLHYVPGDLDNLTAPYREWLPSGSYLAISHVTAEGADGGAVEELAQLYSDLLLRPISQIRGAFGDLEILDPGLVDVRRWRQQVDVAIGPLPLIAGLGKVR